MIMQYNDRRVSSRPSIRYQPACIEIDGNTSVALMRDLTENGAGFESDMNLITGQPIRYRWGNKDFHYGRVVWVENGRFGVENRSDIPKPTHDDCYRYRSVRVPTAIGGVAYVGGKRKDCEVLNIAQRGVCISISGIVERGSLATIKIGKHCLEAATAKWVEGERLGFALSRPLRLGEISAILAA